MAESEGDAHERAAWLKLRGMVGVFQASQPERAHAEARQMRRAERKEAQVNFKCLPSWKRRLTLGAAALGMSASEVVEAAVNEYLARRAGEKG